MPEALNITTRIPESFRFKVTQSPYEERRNILLAIVKAGDLEQLKWCSQLDEYAKFSKAMAYSPLCSAAEFGHLHIVRWLLEEFDEHIDVHVFADYPIVTAIRNTQLHLLDYFFNENKQLHMTEIQFSLTLTSAVQFGNLEALKWITANIEADFYLTDENAWAFRAACQRNYLEMVQYVVEFSDIPIDFNPTWKDATLLAERDEATEVLNYLNYNKVLVEEFGLDEFRSYSKAQKAKPNASRL